MTSMPAAACLRTTSATAARICPASAAASTGTPSSLANIARTSSGGRGRLPVWVQRNRSVLRRIASSRVRPATIAELPPPVILRFPFEERDRNDPDRCPPAGGKPRSARRRPGLLRAGGKLYRADQRADRAQRDAPDRLPPRGRSRLHGGRRRAPQGPRRGGDGIARAGPVERDGVAAHRLSRRHPDGHADRPGRARRFRPARLAGAELFAAAVGRHQAGDRGQRAGAGLGSGRPRLSRRRKRHPRAGGGDPARGHFRRRDRCGAQPAAAERPLVLVGGALLADAVLEPAALADLNRFAESWVLPISPTHRRPQLFDARHPNYGGYMGIRVPPPQISEMKKADLLVALGERMTDTVSQSYSFPAAPQPQLPFVHIWPDGNEIGRVWRPDLGIPASPHEVIKALLRRGAPADAQKRREWVAGLNAIHRKLLAKEWEPTTDGINFAAIVCEIDKHLAPDATVTTDAGNFGSFVHRYIGFGQRQVFLSSVVGAMGSGVPMAVAAALRRPGTQVVAFVGDGGALMMGNEIATAMQYGAAPIIVISDNGMYGTIGMHSYVRYPERPFMAGTRLTNPDFAAWARSFGADGITIEKESEIADGIARAFAVKTRPVVVHCRTSAIQMSAWRRYTRSESLP